MVPTPSDPQVRDLPSALPVVLVHGMRMSGSMWGPVAARLRPEAAITGGFSDEAVLAVTDSVIGVDWRAELALYRGPIWLVNGGLDQFRGGERQWLAACADGRLAVWPRLDHMVIEELRLLGETLRLPIGLETGRPPITGRQRSPARRTAGQLAP